MEMNAANGSEQSGSPADAHAGASDGSNAQGGDFLSGLGLDQAARESFEAEGLNTSDKVGEVYKNAYLLKQKLGNSLTVPGENATPEDRQAFFDKASKAWTPEGYEFKMPEGLPETFAYDQDFAKEAADWFKESGLHPNQAQALHDKWVGKMAEAQSKAAEAEQAKQQAMDEAKQKAHQDLVKEFGDPQSDGYRNIVAKAERAMSGLDAADWLTEKGILSEPGEGGARQVLDPQGVRLLAKIADGMFAEDGLLGDGGGGKNPFASDSVNLTAQSKLLRERPQDARSLIIAAGKDPAKFNL